MANPISNSFRLIKAGLILSFYGVLLAPKGTPLPWPLKLWKIITWPLRALAFLFGGGLMGKSASERLVKALTKLGPSYIKLGQFLATRPDVVGPKVAKSLEQLQDRLPPFEQKQAIKDIENQLGQKLDEIFVEFSKPIAAASIAQVHKAKINQEPKEQNTKDNDHCLINSPYRAVKILRPNIEKRFGRDQASFGFAARMIERFSPESRRLKPTSVVKTLDKSMKMELDLRLEAAALSEMAENMEGEDNFRLPKVDWDRSTRRILTTEWIDGTPINDVATIDKKGFDRPSLANDLFRIFLRQAMSYGFFHADMHPGNLFIDDDGRIVAVDFGIMSRLSLREQRFLAEILHGFLTRDYIKAAKAHFEAGYVPPHHAVESFAQGLRAIGEPIAGKDASEMSMGGFLGQLFEYTSHYDMQTRPELILLQKNLVIVEGVCRMLNPRFSMWEALSPIVKEWLAKNRGPIRALKEGAAGLEQTRTFMAQLPYNLPKIQMVIDDFAAQSEARLQRLDHPSRLNSLTFALWVIGTALAAIAVKYCFF